MRKFIIIPLWLSLSLPAPTRRNEEALKSSHERLLIFPLFILNSKDLMNWINEAQLILSLWIQFHTYTQPHSIRIARSTMNFVSLVFPYSHRNMSLAQNVNVIERHSKLERLVKTLTWNPTGSGSCWICNLISSPARKSSVTASWCVADVTSLPFTFRILSPIRNFPQLAAMPSGTICRIRRIKNGFNECALVVWQWLYTSSLLYSVRKDRDWECNLRRLIEFTFRKLEN